MWHYAQVSFQSLFYSRVQIFWVHFFLPRSSAIEKSLYRVATSAQDRNIIVRTHWSAAAELSGLATGKTLLITLVEIIYISALVAADETCGRYRVTSAEQEGSNGFIVCSLLPPHFTTCRSWNTTCSPFLGPLYFILMLMKLIFLVLSAWLISLVL